MTSFLDLPAFPMYVNREPEAGKTAAGLLAQNTTVCDRDTA